MIREDIIKLRRLQTEVFDRMPKRHQKEMQDVKMELERQKARCDHKHEDGMSAIARKICQICNRTILGQKLDSGTLKFTER